MKPVKVGKITVLFSDGSKKTISPQTIKDLKSNMLLPWVFGLQVANRL